MRTAKSAPHILLVNPWIHDFAAYDVWAKPYGLLSLAGMLRMHGARISYIDCLDRFHPKAPPSDPAARHGRGPYLKTAIPHPKGLEAIERTYSRYGIAPEWFLEDLNSLVRPDMIMVTSSMTYWYPGVFETISHIRQVFDDVPVVLGGVYARLCPEHARSMSGADVVVEDDGECLLSLVENITGYAMTPRFQFSQMDAWPYPALDLQHLINYAPLLTARGCPFRCAYCASPYLEPTVKRRTPASVVEEIHYWHRQHGVVDFAFYDDALLVCGASHALPIFEGVKRLGLPVFFHTPNAIHIRSVDAPMAVAMKAAGLYTIRLGLETTAFENRTGLDDKVTRQEFVSAVGHLKAAGFDSDQMGAYLLVGLPDQTFDAVQASIEVVKDAGAQPVLAYYTPIPHTRLWPRAVAVSRYDLASDPIFSNNAIFPCQRHDFSWKELSRLKQMVNG